MALYSQVLPTLKGRKLLKACTHRAVLGSSLNSDHTRGFSAVTGFSAQLEGTSKLVALSCPGHCKEPRFAHRVLCSCMPGPWSKGILLQPRTENGSWQQAYFQFPSFSLLLP